jgi:hypothetical protein
MSREFYVPKGAVKVTDKKSDAVAYLYSGGASARAGGKPVPCARVFYGKQAKPVAAYQYLDETKRADAIVRLFQARQAWADAKAKRAAERNAQGHGAQVGQFLSTSWGYDQTNVDFYQITKLIGRTMVELVKVPAIAAGGEGGAAMSDKVIPGAGKVGAPFRVVMKNGRARVDGHSATVWDGLPKYRSWYA